MSRVGKLPIEIPSGIKVSISAGKVLVEGSKGKMEQALPRTLEAKLVDNQLLLAKKNEEKQARSDFGTYRSLINNMVVGLSSGFKKDLEIVGVGYKAQVAGKVLELSLGYSHPIKFQIPTGIEIAVTDRNTKLSVSGFDKRQVGFIAAQIREFRPPEPYKGKGVKYADERIRRKVGKAAVGSGA